MLPYADADASTKWVLYVKGGRGARARNQNPDDEFISTY